MQLLCCLLLSSYVSDENVNIKLRQRMLSVRRDCRLFQTERFIEEKSILTNNSGS